MITYASGLKAVTIVWIANPFIEEHRAALDWLNAITDQRFNFFGLEVELWRIGDSQVAPKFNIAAKPNDWSRTVSEGVARVVHEGLTEARNSPTKGTKSARRQFPVARESREKTRTGDLNRGDTEPRRLLGSISSRWNSETNSYSSGEIRVELVMSSENAKSHFESLMADREAIESEIGYPLVWHNLDETKSTKVCVRQSANTRDPEGWKEQSAWLLAKLEDFKRVFGPRVKGL